MVSSGYTNLGEEWAQKYVYRQDLTGTRDTTLEVLLFDDSTDSTDDTSDVGDITTEPTDGNYTRQTINLDSADVSLSLTSGDVRATAQVTFDVTNTTGQIDAVGAILDFQSTVVNSEGAQNPHLIYTGSIGDTDLANYEGDYTVEIRLDLT